MAILAVFIAGLMVGRTPEYLGKKVESREVEARHRSSSSIPPLVILAGASVSAVTPSTLSSLGNAGPHGSDRDPLRVHSSAAGNNGSAFAGLDADTPWFNLTLGLAMLIGRFWMIILVLAIAGSRWPARSVAPPSPARFPTTGPLFLVLLIGVIVIVGALTFLPALSAGPGCRALPGSLGQGVLDMPDGKLRAVSAWDRAILRAALLDSLRKLDPRVTARNPVMLVVAVGAVRDDRGLARGPPGRARVPPSRPGSPCRWRSGCGSRCCSRTSQRRSPRVAARRRPRRCAACAARPWRAGRRTRP